MDQANDERQEPQEHPAHDLVARRLAELETEVQRLRGSRARQLTRSAALSLAVSLLVVAATAVGQDLTTFSAGTPARASEVNGNFALLKAWLERKVGDVDSSCSDASCSVSVRGDVASTGTVSGATLVSGGTVSAAGAMTGASLAVTGALSAGSATVTGGIALGGPDVRFTGGGGRGDGGRALTHASGDTLIVNAGGELSGGTRVESPLVATRGLTVSSGELVIGTTTLRDVIRNYVRTECSIRIGWRDNCNAPCNQAPARQGPRVRGDGTCTDGDSANTTMCSGAWGGLNFDGDVNGDDSIYVTMFCN